MLNSQPVFGCSRVDAAGMLLPMAAFVKQSQSSSGDHV